MLDKKIWENFSYLTIIQLLMVLMPLIYYPHVVRVLGTDSYGEVLIAQAFVGFFSILVNFGFNISATRKAAIYRDNPMRLSILFSGVFYCKLILFLSGSVLFFVISYFFDSLWADKDLVYIAYAICLADVFLVQWFYQGIEKMKLVALSNLLARFISLILIFLLISEKNDAGVFLYILSCSIVFSNLLMFLLCIYKYNVKLLPVKLSYIKILMRESSLFFTSRVSVVFIDKVNVTIIGSISGAHFVSLYDLASKLTSLIQLPLNMLNQAVYPRVAKSKDIRFVFKLIKVCLLLSIPVYGASIFLAPLFIQAYAGFDLLESSNVFYILCINVIINTVSHFMGNCVLVVFGYNKEFNVSIFLGALVYLILLSFFVTLGLFDVYISATLMVAFSLTVMAFRLTFAHKKGLIN